MAATGTLLSRWGSTPSRPDPSGRDGDRTGALYVGSYLVLRLLIGFIGILLPMALYLGDAVIRQTWRPRNSLSAYYHSDLRDVFVGSLCAIAVFLVTYMVFHRNLDNLFSTVAGITALGVALFPTAGGRPLTGLQRRLGEQPVSDVHFVSAAIFILSLAAISVLFGWREGVRRDRPDPRRRRWWRRFHWTAAAVIVAAVAGIVLADLAGVAQDYAVFAGETVAVVAFGVSWLAKGLELDMLRLALRQAGERDRDSRVGSPVRNRSGDGSGDGSGRGSGGGSRASVAPSALSG